MAAGSTNATARAIDIGSLSGNITNIGTLRVTASASSVRFEF
jgi:hypothetical protein